MHKYYTLTEKSDCTTCSYFVSWRDVFFGDTLEPEEYGRCEHGKSPHHYEGVCDEDFCDYHESKPEHEPL